MTYCIITKWNIETLKVEKGLFGEATLAAAQARAAALPEPWRARARVLAEPTERDLSRWFVDDPAAPAAVSYIAASPPARSALAAGVVLTRAEFFTRWAAAAALQPGEPSIVEWTATQLAASSLPETAKALYLDRVDTAVSFPRIDGQLGDVMSVLGGVFGLDADQVDALFLNDPVAILRADCPLSGPIVPFADRLAALEASVADGAS